MNDSDVEIAFTLLAFPLLATAFFFWPFLLLGSRGKKKKTAELPE